MLICKLRHYSVRRLPALSGFFSWSPGSSVPLTGFFR